MFVPHLSTTQPSIFHSSSTKASLRHARKRASSLRYEHHLDGAKTYTSPIKTAERTRRASSPSRTSSRRSDRQVYEMPLASTDVASISALASTARNLFRRAKISGPDFAAVAAVVRSLHTVVKHLRAEAEDPDSLLNSTQQQSSVYARQLTPIVEDTDFTLKQLDTILEKYGSYPSDYNNDDGEAVRRDRAAHGRLEDRERDMLQLIRTKLANQKTHIDIFLDTVQLHNPANRPMSLEITDDKQQNSIKDKVDIVAQRLFQRRAKARASGDAAEESEEEMWQQFWTELVKEGFSSDVLRKHKEVLRAYIRELEENGSVDDNPPSVRGLLDHANSGAAYAPHQYLPYPDAAASAYGSRQQYGSSPLPPPVAIPSSYQSRGDNTSPKELLSPAMDNEKFAPSVKLARRRPDQSPVDMSPDSRTMGQYNPTSMPAQLSYERRSSDSDNDSNEQLALISTRDLMDSDSREAETLARRIGGLNLSPALLPVPNNGISPGTSPCGKYQPPELNLSSSPRYLPPLSTRSDSPTSSLMTPPPAYSATSAAAPVVIPSSAPTTTSGFPPCRPSRLAPDSKGADIPLEAKWTRIKRSLVSPEVLDRAGMRYEARPDFVAVLGVLSREHIAYLARKTVEVRSGRARGYSDTSRTREKAYYPEEKRGPARKSSRHEDTTDDEESFTSSEALWDESDTSDSDSESRPPRTRERAGSATDKYIPRDVRRQRRHRRDSATVIQEEPEDADDDRRSKGRSYPIIVPPMNEKGTPASTVLPKPILKNRNENHVRFDADGPREMSSGEWEREKERKRRRRDRDADESRRRRDRSDKDRERDRDRERESHRDRSDRHREREHHSSSHRHRDRDDTRERRRTKKSVWGETLGAVGIGGAAVSLLSVLTEAAAGF